ncbi:MAG: oxygen-independent coproporphyrinogen III oxidase [Bacteroidetes bacterium]|nr:oxygen-independent coproporphyrinogen III oxidase [Bacteroidota bacterium]
MSTASTHQSDVFELLPLLEKYNRPGPRYTSYPTAPVFNTSYTAADHEKQLRETSDNISLYVHLPFCDTLCYFCGCTMLVSNNRERVANYLNYLDREIEKTGELVKGKNIIQLHWGGGTPTHLTPTEIRTLGQKLHKHFTFSPDAEISVEIDPREIGEDHIRALADVGFRRASIGVQDIDEKVQEAINRIQPEELTREVIGWCRKNGFESINVDLIYGLPYQSRASFNATVEKVLTFEPDRLALYNFAYVPWLKPHQKLIQIDTLPQTDEKLLLFADATTRFMEAGYDYIGMDHFAKPNDELALARKDGTLQRNFQGYSTRAGRDLVGLGMSAISHIGPSFSQNEKVLDKYYARIDKGELPVIAGLQMTDDDLLREHVIMRLMCDFHLEKAKVEKKYGIEFNTYFADSLERLKELEADGLAINAADAVTITDNGRFFIRNIAMCFDAYLPKMQTAKPMFSKTL